MAYISFQPSDHYSTKLYTGTGSSNAITSVGFQPDFTWIKARTGSKSHRLFDSPRGVTNWIASDNGGPENTTAESLKSFDSDGFTLGTYDHVNDNTVTFASWNWKAGTTTGIAGSPSITPTSYSFNATSGFSIIKYTGNGVSGATLPHGLGVAPQLIIIKNRDATMDWVSYHEPLGNTKYMVLNTTGAAATSTTRWNDTTPGATLFTIGDTDKLNSNTVDYIAYVWAPIRGYSKFGSITGNGNADGPFIYTGFRPAFVMTKSIQDAGDNNWHMMDDKRNGFNDQNWLIQADLAIAEETGASYEWVNLLSNGFKIITSNGSINSSSQSYLYMAFAEFPLVSSNSKPGTAR